MTPTQYLNHLRLEQAARMLKNNEQKSITEIALQCGFYSSQYFATVFLHAILVLINHSFRYFTLLI